MVHSSSQSQVGRGYTAYFINTSDKYGPLPGGVNLPFGNMYIGAIWGKYNFDK